MIPPKPPSRPRRVSLLAHLRAFRRDILSAQPDHLFDARMAEFRAPFLRSFLINEPELIARVLGDRNGVFPKSRRVVEGLRPLLGDAVFVTNGALWERQRRIVDPAFGAARTAQMVPAIEAAAADAISRLAVRPGEVELEEVLNHLTADVIFRVLFSRPISDPLASETYRRFRSYQRAQPLLNLGAFLPLPRWVPRFHSKRVRDAALALRGIIRELVEARAAELEAGTAPDDLASRLMTGEDPATSERFGAEEMVDQVAIFLLAGHETSAAVLSWTLYCLARAPEMQARVAEEARLLPPRASMADIAKLGFTRNAFREALRLYPAVPMMVRSPTSRQEFRGRHVRPGDQVVISQWHLHRHRKLWTEPDRFDPDRFDMPPPREAYLPFSAGPRVCPGASLAMAEGTLLTARLLGAFRLAPIEARPPLPVAHLTLRSRDGIWVTLAPRPRPTAPEDPQAHEAGSPGPDPSPAPGPHQSPQRAG